MKKLIKILIIAFAFISGVTFSQTVSPAYSGTTAPCTQTLCQPFNQNDLKQIWQAIMYVGKGGAVSSTSVVAGNMGGFTAKVSSSISVDGVYTTSLNVGGIKTFTAMRAGQSTCVLEDISIFDNGAQAPNVVIDFYRSSPTGTLTDRVAAIINDSEAYLGTISFSSSDYVNIGGVSRASSRGLGLVLKSLDSSTGNIYYTVTITSGSASYTNKVITLKFGLLQD